MKHTKFAALILTHGRPNNVYTYETLRRSGYTGPIYFLVDNEDKTADQYGKKFGKKNVIIFDKLAISKKFDQADNFDDRRSIVYARNASFEVAKKLKLDYFIQLDDDYTTFQYRFDKNLHYNYSPIKSIDDIFDAFIDFLESSKISSIAFAQGGDFIGGAVNTNAQSVRATRKCMNSFFCSVKRPFKFIGRINEDVNTYTKIANLGKVFLTTTQVSLTQRQTQQNAGGMTDIYLKSGTYVKSFYSVIFQPSSVKVKVLMDRTAPRLHHSVDWRRTVPKILREDIKK